MVNLENIQTLIGNHVAPYIYNAKSFEPGKTPIYYSGPYWDNKETEAAIDTFLNGKWITTGEPEEWRSFKREDVEVYNLINGVYILDTNF